MNGSGSILGDIAIAGGIVTEISATGVASDPTSGVIGSATAPVTITTSNPGSGTTASIALIQAKSIWADINLPNTSAPRGDVFMLTTTGSGTGQGSFSGSLRAFSIGESSGNSIDLSGDLNASIELGGTVKRPVVIDGSLSTGASLATGQVQDLSLGGSVTVMGDLDGTLRVGNDQLANITVNGAVNGSIVVGNSLVQQSTITVGGDMQGDISIAHDLAGTITVPAGGLKGQVMVNAANSGGTWTGTVNVGSIQLKPNNTASPDDSAPFYRRVSSNLGGGAVGLAPFNLYGPDCAPENDPNGTGIGIFENALHAPGGHVEARFYGPIQKKNAAAWSTHVMVQCRPLPPNPDCNYPWTVDPCSWIDVSSAFDVAGPEASTTDQLARRTITLSPRAGYHVRPGIYMAYPVESDSVKSADVAGNPAAA